MFKSLNQDERLQATSSSELTASVAKKDKEALEEGRILGLSVTIKEEVATLRGLQEVKEGKLTFVNQVLCPGAEEFRRAAGGWGTNLNLEGKALSEQYVSEVGKAAGGQNN